MIKTPSVAIIFPQTIRLSEPTDTLLVVTIIGIILSCITMIISVLAIIVLICIGFYYCSFFFYNGITLLIALFFILIDFAPFVMIKDDTEL
jgi:hypothetical protein